MKRLLIALSLATTAFALEQAATPLEQAGPSAQDFHRWLQESAQGHDWWAVIDYADILSGNFPDSPYSQDAPFLMGEAYLQLGQLEMANQSLSDYLQQTGSLNHFEEALTYKFEIAELYRNGKKKHLFESHKLPAWMPAQEDAIQLYDEVIAALPHSPLAARALLGKALVQIEIEDYKPSLETLQQLIRKFRREDVAAQAYVEMGRVYLLQAKNQRLDPDLLDLAELNLKKFRLAFPREERIKEVEQTIGEMKEVFAESLVETGRFYQKTGKKPAALIYYKKTIAKFPQTRAAEIARERLHALDPAAGQMAAAQQPPEAPAP